MAVHSGSLFSGEASRDGLRFDSSLFCLLAFSLTGLFADVAALVSSGHHLTAWAFALIAAAPALAAIAALRVADDDLRSRGRTRRGWN